MLNRFSGPDGHHRLVELLLRQTLVAGDHELAEAIAGEARFEELEAGSLVLEQDATDSSILFLLSGSASVVVNGRLIAVREAGTQVGEGAVVDLAARRNASVVTREPTLLARVSGDAFARIMDFHPEAWQRLARELSRRLQQRNVFHRPPNVIPHLFIGCSTELLSLGEGLRDTLGADDLAVALWTDGVFGAGAVAIDSLLEEVSRADFAILVLGADDVVSLRGVEMLSPRDNVIFELGLFMGAMGRGRALLMRPRDIELRLPTDLLGITPLSYTAGSDEIAEAITLVAAEIRAIVANLGPR